MKKLVIASTLAAIFASESAFAKTQGSYLGLDFISIRNGYYQKNELDTGPKKEKPVKYGSNFGFGVNYKYAFNANGFFIAPGLFYENDSPRGAKVNGGDQDYIQTRSRYGVRTDIGYDISEVIAPYVVVGYGVINYKAQSNGYNQSAEIVTATQTGTTSNVLFGGGLKFSLSKNIALNLEYNYQKYTTKNAIPVGTSYYINKSSFVNRVDTAKIGLSLNF